MRPTAIRTVLAGLAGGVALNLVMVLTFRLVGFGWDGKGILMKEGYQSDKLIRVWREDPKPRVLNMPPVAIGLGLVAFGVVHAFVYRTISPVWPRGIARRAARMGLLVFLVCFVFWEFFTPFNQLHEPLLLIALELLFWALIALAEGLAIAAVMERGGAAAPPAA